MKFTTTIARSGPNNTGIVVPPEIIDALGQGKKPPVRVTLNGYTYRSTVAVMGGAYMISVSSEIRKAASVAGGDTLEIDLEYDDQPRTVDVPPLLAEVLAKDPVAKAAFDALSNSHKKQHTLAIEGAKSEETRQRRVEKTLAMLRGE